VVSPVSPLVSNNIVPFNPRLTDARNKENFDRLLIY
ncbi:MAG: hypothetical protein ACI87Q_002044, partial [Pseudohongiellaceae bacterium]